MPDMDVALVRLLQLVSPSLPVGAFAYSQGLESAVTQGLVTDESSTQEWVCGVLNYSIKQLDLPVLHCLLVAFNNQDTEEVETLNNTILAFRETQEIRDESISLGRALKRLLQGLELDLSLLPASSDSDWATAFACACYASNVQVAHSMLGYAWAWCENQIAAAVKLVPLGQTQGQRLLMKIGAELPNIIEQARVITLDDIGATAPNLAILSSQHELQYSRLFRS